MNLNKLHHVAIICSDYEQAKEFYVGKLGLPLIREVYRPERRDYILTLLAGNVEIELFIMENPPQRITNPEARGLRHLAFHVENIDPVISWLNSKMSTIENSSTIRTSQGIGLSWLRWNFISFLLPGTTSSRR